MKTLKFLASSHPNMGSAVLKHFTATAAAAIKEDYNLFDLFYCWY